VALGRLIGLDFVVKAFAEAQELFPGFGRQQGGFFLRHCFFPNAKKRSLPRAPGAFGRRAFVNDDTKRTLDDARMSLTATETENGQAETRRLQDEQPCEMYNCGSAG
jgi:hypothetical protein